MSNVSLFRKVSRILLDAVLYGCEKGMDLLFIFGNPAARKATAITRIADMRGWKWFVIVVFAGVMALLTALAFVSTFVFPASTLAIFAIDLFISLGCLTLAGMSCFPVLWNMRYPQLTLSDNLDAKQSNLDDVRYWTPIELYETVADALLTQNWDQLDTLLQTASGAVAFVQSDLWTKWYATNPSAAVVARLEQSLSKEAVLHPTLGSMVQIALLTELMTTSVSVAEIRAMMTEAERSASWVVRETVGADGKTYFDCDENALATVTPTLMLRLKVHAAAAVATTQADTAADATHEQQAENTVTL